MNICIEDNRYLRKFFHQHAEYQDHIVNDIHKRLPYLLTNQPAKIKPVHHAKYNQHRVLEYKIVADNHMACRVAFTVDKETITVFFMSEVLIKAHFCKVLLNTELLD